MSKPIAKKENKKATTRLGAQPASKKDILRVLTVIAALQVALFFMAQLFLIILAQIFIFNEYGEGSPFNPFINIIETHVRQLHDLMMSRLLLNTNLGFPLYVTIFILVFLWIKKTLSSFINKKINRSIESKIKIALLINIVLIVYLLLVCITMFKFDNNIIVALQLPIIGILYFMAYAIVALTPSLTFSSDLMIIRAIIIIIFYLALTTLALLFIGKKIIKLFHYARARV